MQEKTSAERSAPRNVGESTLSEQGIGKAGNQRQTVSDEDGALGNTGLKRFQRRFSVARECSSPSF